MLRLVSSSPRRIELLRLLQVPFEPTAPDLDEARVRHQAAPVASISLAVVPVRPERALSSLELGEIAAEVEALAKQRGAASAWAIDWRTAGAAARAAVAYARRRRCRSGSKC